MRTWSTLLLLFLVFVNLRYDCAFGHLSLFIDQEETFKLLGLAAEIVYVRDGKVDSYPLSFEMPVPPEIPVLNFSWENRASVEVNYAIYVNVTSPEHQQLSAGTRVLLPPSLSIPNSGVVPHRRSEWSVNLECSGLETATVDVSIMVLASTQVSARALLAAVTTPATSTPNPRKPPSSDVLVVPLKRKKTCAVNPELRVINNKKTESQASLVSQELHQKPSAAETEEVEDPALLASPSDMFFIVAGSAVGAVFAAVCLGVAVYWTRTKYGTVARSSASVGASTTSTGVKYHTSAAMSEQRTVSPSLGSEERHLLMTPSDATSDTIQTDPAATCGFHLIVRVCEQECSTGRIVSGLLLVLSEEVRRPPRDVTVKQLTSPEQLQEAALLLRPDVPGGKRHAHLLAPLAILHHVPCVVYPYAGVNLKHHLHRLHANMSKMGMTTVVRLGAQLAEALHFLHSPAGGSLVHPDVAARNCFVDSAGCVLQLSDACLSRDLYPGDYEPHGIAGDLLPVRWMSPEALLHQGPVCDIWALGVTLWELCTLGREPFGGAGQVSLPDAVLAGLQLPQPPNCPDQLYAVMVQCWQLEPGNRPSPEAVETFLDDLLAQLHDYI
ncbi:unnamed protein product [Notodromas monacha]|uniref:Uncharacterized protein n=1 Tax=Notodromas monacha TaxID=399045 RepID=A0A7R9GEZ2_9CRUS|nr:unnamed protein product [Notodromas monacha]CAG0918340.1 unnamed protein product [Notodromas monacha]